MRDSPSINSRIREIRDRMAKAAHRCGRQPREVRLMAATKHAAVEQIRDAIASGIGLIGENYVQDAAQKSPQLPQVEKHFIGSLQSNKVKLAVKLFDCIQSVDSLRLAKEIDKAALEQNKAMPVFIEINPGEESKGGVPFGDAGALYNQMVKLPHIKIRGLMGIAPLHGDARAFFRRMKKTADELGLKELSMGMSDDFEIAIEEGSTMVRVGRALFA
ncbi:MAG: YggS family pyridoxal phosphate-dependent enzyme [Nanoarchaeota archaeon]